MTKLKIDYLKLIIDNTGESKLQTLLKKQENLIKKKIYAQDQIKAMKVLSDIYGDEIIKIENELLKITRRKEYVERTAKQFRDAGTNRNKDKNTNGDVV
jgi:hypothetical protein|tara:strand:- start:209 stop:505 length:297 start_codon:yes stop_codon:yes gene_type:complete